MRKTILALLLLLFVLIVVCAYEKTYAIYEQRTENTPVPPNIQTVTAAKVETTKQSNPMYEAKRPIVKVSEAIVSKVTEEKPQEQKAVKMVQEPKVITSKPEKKEVEVKKTENQEPKVEKENIKETQEKVAQELKVEKENTKGTEEKVSTLPNKNIASTEEKTINTSKKDVVPLETIDSLMEALKDRDLVLQERNELLKRIEALIKQALADRVTAIDNMNQEEQRLLDIQQKLITERDNPSTTQNNTQNTGE